MFMDRTSKYNKGLLHKKFDRHVTVVELASLAQEPRDKLMRLQPGQQKFALNFDDDAKDVAAMLSKRCHGPARLTPQESRGLVDAIAACQQQIESSLRAEYRNAINRQLFLSLESLANTEQAPQKIEIRKSQLLDHIDEDAQAAGSEHD